MNINVQLPSIPPLNLIPSTEAAKRDTQLREVIPQTPANNAARSDNKTPNEQNPSRNITKEAAASVYSQDSMKANDEAAKHARINEEQKGSSEQGSSGQDEQASQYDEKQKKQAEIKQAEQKQADKEQEEQEKVASLQARHQEVVTHEQAHKAAGGQHAGAVSYDYEKGPDGRSYAVSGEVSIDVSPISGEPQATIQKMQQVRRAALAPANPSSQDRYVASQASKTEQMARSELSDETQQIATSKPAENSGSKASNDAVQGSSKSRSEYSNAHTVAPRLVLAAEEALVESDFVVSELLTSEASVIANVFPKSTGIEAPSAYGRAALYSQRSNLYADTARASGVMDGMVASDIKIAQVNAQTELQSQVIDNRYQGVAQSSALPSFLLSV